MVNYFQLSAIILAGVAVAIADAIIKKISVSSSFWLAFKNPWMLAIILLYLAQIIFFVYVFMNKWNLGFVGVLQMVFYSVTVVLVGLLYFGENITLLQGIGMIFALIGIVLINV